MLERLAEKEAHLLALSEEQCGGIDLDQMISQKERHNNEFIHSLDVLSRQVNYYYFYLISTPNIIQMSVTRHLGTIF